MKYSTGTTQLINYANNLVQAVSRKDPTAKEFIDWFKEHGSVLGLPGGIMKTLEEVERKHGVPDTIWKELRAVLNAKAGRASRQRKTDFDNNMQTIVNIFGLDPIEGEVLNLAASYQLNRLVEIFCDSCFQYCKSDKLVDVATVLGLRLRELQTRLQQHSPLISMGLIEFSQGSCHHISDKLGISDRLLQALTPPRKKEGDLKCALVGEPCRSDLTWNDFDHLGEQRDLLARVVQGALRSKEKGLNILLYGPPGTGKTEFSKVLAAKLYLDIYAIGEADDEGDEPNRLERIQSLKMAQQILGRRSGALLLFDEMEDAFMQAGIFTDRISRVFAHRLLEKNSVPVLWCCNYVEGFDPAFLRRMTMAIEFKNPSVTIRKRIWNRILTSQKLVVPEEELDALTREIKAPPALAANAVRAARLASGGVKEIRLVAQGVAKAMAGGADTAPEKAILRFKPELANVDIDLDSLAEKLAKSGTRKVSFCLHGAPGTGKSALARYLAQRMGLEVLQKRASDLLSMFVGGSEKSIAAAFQEAREQEAMLIFDEADSLLADRTKARQSWEISQVNEMLTWMESHPLPFVCTTNFAEHLDQASLRRFTFKIGFEYLAGPQLAQAFIDFFGLAPSPAIERIERLTPGDFAVVQRKAEVLGLESDIEALLRMLEDESRAKSGANKNRIGF